MRKETRLKTDMELNNVKKKTETSWLLPHKKRIHSPGYVKCQGVSNDASIAPQLLAAGIACCGSLSMGFALGFSSPVIPDLQSKFNIDSSAISWFGSLLMLGGTVGAILSCVLMELMGRKAVLLVANLPLVVGYGIIASMESMAWMYIGRTLTGIGMSMMAITVSVYVSETAEIRIRGILATANHIFVAFGGLTVYLLGMKFDYIIISLFGSGIATLMAVPGFLIPETPVWSLKHGKDQEAMASLRWLRGDDASIEMELKEIRNSITKVHEKWTFPDLLQGQHLKPLLLGIMLNIFQKLVGINAIQFYTETIFYDIGFGTYATLPPVIAAVASIIAVLPSVILVEKIGRKPTLIISGILVCLGCSGLGTFYYLEKNNSDPALWWVPILCIAVYGFGFTIGWGPVAWLLACEICPVKMRDFGIVLTSVSHWFAGFLVAKAFPILVEATSYYVVFWLFAAMSILASLYVICLVPETKDKSLEDIAQNFATSRRSGILQ